MAPAVLIEYAGIKEPRRCSLSEMMGKKRKLSKGQEPYGFVPDYRHGIEAIGESEGVGNSERADLGMAASEDSCAPKRKCISLNSDCNGSFGVHLQVLSLSKMARSEMRDLELRLRTELEQVQALQRRIFSMSSNVAALSPSSDVHSFSVRKNKPTVGSFKRSPEVHAARGKKRAPLGGYGPRTKRNGIGHSESLKEAKASSTSNAMLMKQCETLLNRLMSHPQSWVFNTPVDVVKLNIPDYFTIIKNPMDLGTVKSKLLSGQYSSPRDFAADVRLTFSNAKTYNPPSNAVHVMADTLSKFFEVRWKPIEKKLPVISNLESAVPSGSVIDLETESAMPPLKKLKPTVVDHKFKPDPVKRVMSEKEKHALSTELEALLGELPDNIVDFLKQQSSSNGQTTEDEIEIDIDALSDDTLFTLQILLNAYLLEKRKKLANVEPSEVELPNESGLSNLSMQPCKGNDSIDEDIDIVGNDPANVAYPPVEIEKDAVRNSKCRSSSSSSSGSGSSSSDSDSDSGSGSEIDGAEAPVPAHAAMEKVGSGVNVNEKKNDLVDSGAINQSLGLGQVEQTSQSKSVSAETDDQQDGESAPSERQVSPEKLYRAALLRNRFADTILKAREKTLEKSEKLDPERLRFEKEELERRKKEEKARLRAEAKAAEEARRKAEAEAVAEAKRRREMEREAARLALQKMEKTVDINENSQFLEDLEMLRGAPDEELTFINEMSPERSLNALGSFKFEGTSNPLEQLGLYMKDVDEEEEDGEPQRILEPENDLGEEDGEVQGIIEPVNDAVEDGEAQRIVEPVNAAGEENGEIQGIAEQLCVGEEDGVGQIIPNDAEEEEGEVRRIPAPENYAEEETEALRIPLAINDAEEEEGGPQRNPEPVNDAEEETEALRIPLAINDAEEEGGPQRNPEPVNDVEEEESEPRRSLEMANNLEEEGELLHRSPEPVDSAEEEGEPQRTGPVNNVEEEVHELLRSPGSVTDVKEEEGELRREAVPVMDVEEDERSEPQRMPEPGNTAEEAEEGVPQRIPEPVNSMEEELSEPQRIPEPANDVAKEEVEPPINPTPMNDVDEDESEPLRIVELINDAEEPQSIPEPLNGVEMEDKGEPRRIPEHINDVEMEETSLQRLIEPMNDVKEEKGEPQRTLEPVNVEIDIQGEPQGILERVNVEGSIEEETESKESDRR